MNAPNHWKTALGLGLAVGAGLAVAGALPVTGLGIAGVMAMAALGPDLDKPPEMDVRTGKVKPGATAAEAHGLISNGVAELVAAISGGHRCTRHWWSTHRYTCSLALGVVVAVLVALFPPWPAFVLVAWWGAWPLYCSMPRGARWSAAWLAAGAAVALLSAGLLPVTPLLGLAVTCGWAAHIACDRLQSALFENGGAFETFVAWTTLAAGAALFCFTTIT